MKDRAPSPASDKPSRPASEEPPPPSHQSRRHRPPRLTRLVRTNPALAALVAVSVLLGTGAVAGGVAGTRQPPALTDHRRVIGEPLTPGEPFTPGEPLTPGEPVAPGTTTVGPDTPGALDGIAGPATALGPAPAPGAAVERGRAGRERCTLDAVLVPRCGVLWGVAPGAFTDLRPSQALRQFEQKTGRPSDILHSYHRGDELFPTADQLSAVRQERKRLLFVNWKVAWGTTWADVTRGGQDARIDRLAAHLKRTFPERFFLALHHEPENDVKAAAGSGMTARDYAAMYRHTIRRLRANGVTNAVSVMVYMAYEPWCVQPWFGELYPGDDVVDWIGFDPYLYARPGGYGHGDFEYLVNRTSDPAKWVGFYNWVTRTYPGKPLMIAEWGVYEYRGDPSKKAWIYSTVGRQLTRFPRIKALVYFDSPSAPKGDTRPDSSGAALTEFRDLAESTMFNVHV